MSLLLFFPASAAVEASGDVTAPVGMLAAVGAEVFAASGEVVAPTGLILGSSVQVVLVEGAMAAPLGDVRGQATTTVAEEVSVGWAGAPMPMPARRVITGAGAVSARRGKVTADATVTPMAVVGTSLVVSPAAAVSGAGTVVAIHGAAEVRGHRLAVSGAMTVALGRGTATTFTAPLPGIETPAEAPRQVATARVRSTPTSLPVLQTPVSMPSTIERDVMLADDEWLLNEAA